MNTEVEYPRNYATRIMLVDALSFLIGLSMLAMPFARGWFPGAFDTTVHVALGALIATPAVFRVLVAYGSLWIEVVLAALGLIVFLLPKFQSMTWNPHYTGIHLALGGGLIVLAAISGLMTAIHLRKNHPAA